VSNFGPRSTRVVEAPPRASKQAVAQPKPSLPALRVADSKLLVAKAWLLGSDIEGYAAEMGGKVRFKSRDWSDRLLVECDRGDLDVAIFNTNASELYRSNTPNSALWISASFAHSMHGRNFCMIVKSGHPLAGLGIAQIRETLSNISIYVGQDTDRYSNLMLVLGATDDSYWAKRNIRIVNVPDPRLETLDTDPDGILVPGQNRRFEAYLAGGYEEIVSYESLEPAVCDELRRRAANSLIVGRSYNTGYGKPEELLAALKKRFRQNTSDDAFVEELAENLADCCDFGANSDADQLQIARHVLYETYDVGDPQW